MRINQLDEASRFPAIKKLICDGLLKFYNLLSVSDAQVAKYLRELTHYNRKLADCEPGNRQRTFFVVTLFQLLGKEISNLFGGVGSYPTSVTSVMVF